MSSLINCKKAALATLLLATFFVSCCQCSAAAAASDPHLDLHELQHVHNENCNHRHPKAHEVSWINWISTSHSGLQISILHPTWNASIREGFCGNQIDLWDWNYHQTVDWNTIIDYPLIVIYGPPRIGGLIEYFRTNHPDEKVALFCYGP